MANQPICNAQRKQEIIKLALEKSPSVASKSSGISINTIKNWLYEARKKAEADHGDPSASLSLRPAAQAEIIQAAVNTIAADVEQKISDATLERYEKVTNKMLDLIEKTIDTLSSFLEAADPASGNFDPEWLGSVTKALQTAIDKYQTLTGGATQIIEQRNKNLNVNANINKADEYDGIFKRIGVGSKATPDSVSAGQSVDTIETDREAG